MDDVLEPKSQPSANMPLSFEDTHQDQLCETPRMKRHPSRPSSHRTVSQPYGGDAQQLSLSTAHHQVKSRNLGRVSVKLLKQLCGVNPFRTSYATLYRPLDSFKEKILLTSAIVLALAAGVPLPIIGLIFGELINQFPLPEDELRIRLGYLMATACAFFAVTWGWSICWGLIGERICGKLRVQSLHRLLGMDQAYYETETPDVTGMLTEKIQTVQLGTSEKVGLFLSSISYFIAAFAVGFYLHAKLAGILLATVIPAMAFIVVLGSSMSSRYSKRAVECGESATCLAESLIAGVRTVQATGSADHLCESHRSELDRKQHWGFYKALVGAAMIGAIYFVAYAANALAFYVGSRDAKNQQSGGAGTIYAVVFLILDASFVVGQFGPFIQTFALAATAGESIFALLDHPTPTIDTYSELGKKVSRQHFDEDVEFKDVNFVYPSRPSFRALDQLHLTIQAGKITGIVGTSGSGKSTIANLLMRLYDPSCGRIMLGALDIRDCHVGSLRSHIALVGQEPVLFNGSILDNIRAGLCTSSDSTEPELYEMCLSAAHDSGCDEFVSTLPDAYNTQVGNSGFTQLSGGQKQRIALARALVSSPALLILDEYTSAMDAKNEALVLERLQKRASKLTVLVIAHRLATVRRCQQIVLMQSGHIVDQGTHEDLLDKEGPYRSLVNAQALHHVDGPSELIEEKEAIVSQPKALSMWNTSPATPSDKLGSASPERERDLDNRVSLMQAIVRILSMSKHNYPFILTGIVAAILSGGTLLGEAVIFGHLIELLNDPLTTFARVDLFCLMFFVVALVALFAHCTSGFSFGIVSERLITNIQHQALRTILVQDIDWFSSAKHSPHHLVSSLSADSGKLSGLSGPILGTIMSASTSVVGGIILAHVVAWKMAIVLLACVPVLLLSGFFRLKVLAKSEDRQQNAYNDATALASEACSNIRTIASLGIESEVLMRYKKELSAPYKQSVKDTILGNILLAFSLSITYFVYALAYWWGSRLVRKGENTQLQFFIVLPALLFSAQAAGMMLSLGAEMTQAAAAAKRMFTLLDSKPTIMANTHPQDKVEPVAKRHAGDSRTDSVHIQLDEVSLSYAARPGVFALSRLSMNILRGQFVALVGQSGGGKSSVISLIERFYDPIIGTVYINGSDVRDLSVAQHRARIALVSQEAELFPGSISSNISLGAKPGQSPSHGDIVRVCQQCGLHDFIMSLPEGYSTDCGTNGSGLSGGQKQRLVIARALIRNPDILLLDEATSQLDAESELDVRNAIAAASKGRTVIMVTHRLSSIQHADKIFVFESGQIIESGTHSDLIRQCGSYAAMVQMQTLR